jgi:hypothetical protein
MLRNIDTCSGEALENASVLCGVDQVLSTKKDLDVSSVHRVINKWYTQRPCSLLCN